MRINLNCPYEEKDLAKHLGARWDGARKTWYIENIEDITPFMRWIGDDKKEPLRMPVTGIARKSQGKDVFVTGLEAPADCGCTALPWERCEHSVTH